MGTESFTQSNGYLAVPPCLPSRVKYLIPQLLTVLPAASPQLQAASRNFSQLQRSAFLAHVTPFPRGSCIQWLVNEGLGKPGPLVSKDQPSLRTLHSVLWALWPRPILLPSLPPSKCKTQAYSLKKFLHARLHLRVCVPGDSTCPECQANRSCSKTTCLHNWIVNCSVRIQSKDDFLGTS
jgi:hypothetical protein